MLKRLADQEINKNYELLSQMMPPKALENLQEGVQVIDRVSQVTVMYADIVGFTQWSASRGSAEVVSMLGQLFTEFDQLCVKHSVYKVHTIGDCYVAMGFRSEKSRNPQKEAENVVRFALDIVDVVRKVNNENGFELAMRIGIHSGEVIGGITGTNVVRYDIYGPDVLIANKMESFGKAGSVSVSEKTKNLMDCEEFEFEESGEFFISSLQVLIRSFVVWIKDKR
jgi:class 3 adenylate cyclase